MKKIDFNTDDLSNLKNSELKKVADYWLRQYLLRMTPHKGNYYHCPIKKRNYHVKKMQVAHFIDRSRMILRYDLDNVRLISEQSNSWDSQVRADGYKSKHHKEYEELLKCEGNLARLLQLKDERKIFKKEDYIALISKFKEDARI